ncbi:RNA-binding protein [Anoxybacillus suryakundensis]|uniref:RNA-binding protein YlmH, contains S4-like domain n=1 Tax=Anoxybacillus suryakundensis TaxID=1325335 RepID=A0A0K6GR41_9BACL|nr:RNA-binding protein [Anoxybacillus suryakundensis]CUA81067.1 RNA-binding protein YlmH, contains S4-like domain [Anoxybacillus suryakundensis]
MDIYQHFRKEEHHFIDLVCEWKRLVTEQYAPKLTDFLTPREQQIVRSIVGNNDEVHVAFFGGSSSVSVERKRALLYPPYMQPNEDDFQLSLFSIRYPKKFVTLGHRDVLGALLSLGVKREKFGDIVIVDDVIQFVVAKEIAPFVKMNVTAIGKAKVSLEEQPLSQLLAVKEEWEEETFTVSSLRLDAILAQCFRISRQKAQALITQNYAKVNWKTVDQAHMECQEGDLLSLRGYGRCRLQAVVGQTKKEKWRIVVEKTK